MRMEISLINRQDVAEPDQSASGVAGTGLKNERKTGIVEYGMMGNVGEFPRQDGCTGTLPVQMIPGEFFAPQIPAQGSGTTKNPPGSTLKDTPVSREKTGKKNRIVLGVGVLYNGGTTSVAPAESLAPGAVPASSPGAGVVRNNTTTPAAPGPDPAEQSVDLIISSFERYERTYDRLNRKIHRLDQRLNKLEERRMQKRDERRS